MGEQRISAPPSPIVEELRGEAERNAQIVRNLFEAVQRRDRDGVLSAYDPGIAIHEAPNLPYGGDYRGHQGGFEHEMGYRAAWDAVQSDAERALDAEILADRVVVLWTQKGRTPSTRESFSTHVVSVYRPRDAHIVDSRM